MLHGNRAFCDHCNFAYIGAEPAAALKEHLQTCRKAQQAAEQGDRPFSLPLRNFHTNHVAAGLTDVDRKFLRSLRIQPW